nr:TGF-beta-activated kinase 1 and MAP3K7-binding protein 2-like [Ciona intestinalis]|eukprot:XP_026690565.1 TGF-beta-activated kinase 1 and MAP3K7-binding protein 2-like [Ciona intestinalis]
MNPDPTYDTEDNQKQWETINDHVQQMLFLTDGITGGSPLSTSPAIPSPLTSPPQVNSRVHHTSHNPMYRRSEGDIQGRPTEQLNLAPTPQTAPVLGFQPHWGVPESPVTTAPTIHSSYSYPVFHNPNPTFQAAQENIATNGTSSPGVVAPDQKDFFTKPKTGSPYNSRKYNAKPTMTKMNLKRTSYPTITVPKTLENSQAYHVDYPRNTGDSSPQVIRQQSSPSIISPTGVPFLPHSTSQPVMNINQFTPIGNTGFNSPERNSPVMYHMSPNLRRKSAPATDTRPFLKTNTRRTVSQIPQHIAPPNGLPGSSYLKDSFLPTLSDPLEKVDEVPTVDTGYNDDDYTNALLQHQTERMNRLRAEYNAKKCELENLGGDVSHLEEKVQQRNLRHKSPSSLQVEIGRLREINRQLEIDCNCMYKEVDLFSKDGDNTREDFYSRYNRPASVKPQQTKQRKASLRQFTSVQDLPPPPPPPPDDEPKWRCSHCTFDNHAALNKCEMCEFPREVQSSRARIT